ncbi:MAG: DUF3106 domain-containing protein [Opitutales bacterium]|nr:DUF3106 domain-containing protein [Opitutales bacterium]
MIFGLRLQLLRYLLPALGLSCALLYSSAEQSAPVSPPHLPDGLNMRPPAPPPDLPDPDELLGQLKQLDDLLAMDPEALRRLRETIDMIANMSAEQREAMRIRLSQITRMTPELRNEINELSQWIGRENRNALSQFWLSLESSAREAKRSHLGSLDENAKREWLANEVEAFRAHRDKVFESMREEKK